MSNNRSGNFRIARTVPFETDNRDRSLSEEQPAWTLSDLSIFDGIRVLSREFQASVLP
jgi:hypothetical protein